MIDNDIEERIHRALEYLKTHPDPPCPPVSTRKLTKEEQREMNMINYGQPTRKSSRVINTGQVYGLLYL